MNPIWTIGEIFMFALRTPLPISVSDSYFSGTIYAVEVAAAETTVMITPLDTHTSIPGTTVTFEMAAQTLGDAADAKFTVTANGAAQEYTSSLVTTWTYPETTLWLSFESTQTAFILTGTGVTEITIPSAHTHILINDIETAVDLAGITTTLSVEGSTNVIVQIPGTTASLEVPGLTAEFTAITTVITTDGETKYCGDQTLEAGDAGSACVMGTTFTIDVSGAILYLHDQGTTEVFNIPGITTTFVPK